MVSNWIGSLLGGGIHQGDSMSPHIFVLFMERLGHIMNWVVMDGVWKTIKLLRHGPALSHLFFADDWCYL